MIKKIIIFFVTVHYTNSFIPPYIKICKRNSPDLAGCIINSVYELKPKLKEGIPELNVPSIEPLPLDEIKLRSGSRSTKIDANITNVKVWGPSSFEILELKPNLAKNKFVFKLNIPHLYFKGDYDVDMNVLILKYKGQGPITGNFTNYGCDVLMKGQIIKIEGKDHLKFDKFKMSLTIGKSYLHLGNLFQEDSNLGRATNDVLNDNSDLFINEIKPVLEDALADKFTEVANIITNTFSYEELFPSL